MSRTSPTQQSHYHILLHPTKPLILLLSEQNGWRFPAFYKEEPTHPSEISAAMQRQLGIDGIVLYYAARHSDHQNGCQEFFYVLEIRSPDWLSPADSQWVGHDTQNDSHCKRHGLCYNADKACVLIILFVVGWSQGWHESAEGGIGRHDVYWEDR